MSSVKKNRPAYRPKKFACKKCPKSFTSRQSLDTHLMKKFPCDLKCRKCGYAATCNSDFKTHSSTHIEAKVNVNSLSSLQDMVVETIEEKLKLVRETRPDGTVIETTEVIKNHTLAGVHGRILQSRLPEKTLMRGVEKALSENTTDATIRTELVQALYPVHDRIPFREPAQPPNILGIEPKPPAKKVFIMARPAPDSPSTWTEVPNDLSVNILAKHARDMYAFVIESGVQRLQSSTFKNNVAQSLIGEEEALVVTLQNDKITTNYSDVKDLSECPSDKKEDADELMKLIQLRKLENRERIKHSLDDDFDLEMVKGDIGRFIHNTKPKETPGFVKVMDIVNVD